MKPATLAGLALLFAACAPSTTTPPAPTTAAATPTPPATAPAPATATAPPTPNDAVIVLPVRSSNAALFPEELEQLRRAVADRVAAELGPGRVLPFDVVDRFEQLARQGRSREGGPVCASPPSAFSIRRAALGRALELEVDARCHQSPCVLHAMLQRPPPGDGGYDVVAEWEIAVPDARSRPGVSAWLDAARALARYQPPATVGGLLAMLGSDDKPHPAVEIRAVHAAGSWTARPTPASFAPVQLSLEACHERGWSWSAGEDAVLSVAPDGSVARCHATTDDAHRGEGRARCVCEALSRAKLAAGEGDRRLEVSFMNQPSSVVSRGGMTYIARLEGAKPPSGMSELGINESQLAACYADAKLPSPRRARVRFRIDGAGNAESAVVTDDDPAFRACVEKALRAGRSSCTPSGAPLQIDASLHFVAIPPQARRGLGALAPQ